MCISSGTPTRPLVFTRVCEYVKSPLDGLHETNRIVTCFTMVDGLHTRSIVLIDFCFGKNSSYPSGDSANSRPSIFLEVVVKPVQHSLSD